MSYTIKLVNEHGNPVQVDRHFEGPNVVIDGSSSAEMDITYNYSFFYQAHIDEDMGIRYLYGRTGYECIPILNAAILALGTVRSPDYWEMCPGNAGWALSVLRKWAIQHPGAKFLGD